MSNKNPEVFLDIKIGPFKAGRIEIEIFRDVVPRTSANFLALCTGEKGNGLSGKPLHLKGCKFHRIIPGFMAQGGDFTQGNGTGGESIYGGKFKDENFIAKHDKPYMLSMANSGPDSNGSQFFITFKPTPHLNGKHVVFGRVVGGMSVVREMEAVQTGASNRPIDDVLILDCGLLDDPATSLDAGTKHSSSKSEKKEKKDSKKDKKIKKEQKKAAKAAAKAAKKEKPSKPLEKPCKEPATNEPSKPAEPPRRSDFKTEQPRRSRSRSRSRSGGRTRRSESSSGSSRSGSRRRKRGGSGSSKSSASSS